MVGTVGRLLRETASNTVTSNPRPADTHQLVMIRESWIEAMVSKVELLSRRILQEAVLARYTSRTVAKAGNVVAIERDLLLLGVWVTSVNTMLRSQGREILLESQKLRRVMWRSPAQIGETGWQTLRRTASSV